MPTKELPYFPTGRLLTWHELAFYVPLEEAVRCTYHVAMKVRLADVVCCAKADWDAGHGDKIARRHIDFVLVDREE